jgi:putative chitinase
MFARKLDRIADQYGDLRINSWYRPPAVNKAVGGAPSSRHIEGDAADVTLAKGTARQKLKFEQSLDKTWNGGIGRGHAFGKGYLHIDTGPKRRWNYN